MKQISPVAFVARCAMLGAALLLLSNLLATSARIHVWLTAVPLALAGVAYAVLQIRLKPERGTLLKRLLLAATFVLWAIDQFLPSGRVATIVGDLVVAAYVVDLFWIIQEQRDSGS
jgi:hypothetical protein